MLSNSCAVEKSVFKQLGFTDALSPFKMTMRPQAAEQLKSSMGKSSSMGHFIFGVVWRKIFYQGPWCQKQFIE